MPVDRIPSIKTPARAVARTATHQGLSAGWSVAAGLPLLVTLLLLVAPRLV
ncbi:MAG: hypothetical protein JNL07_03605 [Rhodospirillales bacterium]|nr:hypothetical protein [Rhodospirillales bacterium]